jgi:hypothetical protein
LQGSVLLEKDFAIIRPVAWVLVQWVLTQTNKQWIENTMWYIILNIFIF